MFWLKNYIILSIKFIIPIEVLYSPYFKLSLLRENYLEYGLPRTKVVNKIKQSDWKVFRIFIFLSRTDALYTGAEAIHFLMQEYCSDHRISYYHTVLYPRRFFYTRHTSSCMSYDCICLTESLNYVIFCGFIACNSNYVDVDMRFLHGIIPMRNFRCKLYFL